nr:MAG TPA: hypothetical protein [Caudoviricetes sp.]
MCEFGAYYIRLYCHDEYENDFHCKTTKIGHWKY